MADLAVRLALKARLPRTWPAFFERHGNFTSAQLATIPALLDGHNLIVCAPTASGKTEAVLAPLVERHCPAGVPRSRPVILYLTPTRALANDLSARITPPLDALGLSLGVKTRDSAFRAARPPDVLITTPESSDSLIAARPKLFARLRAVVIDELHLFDGTPRGDQMRVIFSRIRRIRDYAHERGDAPDASVQYAALSATLAEPAIAAARYFEGAQVVRVPGARAIEAALMPLSPDTSGELTAYLGTFRARGWRKALVFCNSRAEVEAYATVVRERSPFGGAVYVHYSNIDARRRREIEEQFAEAEAAICFASSTLELGIDIGDIDVVVLIGPPGSPGSFVQRLGRGNRRQRVTRGACFYRTPLERLLFEALVEDAGPGIRDWGLGTGDKETGGQGDWEQRALHSHSPITNPQSPAAPATQNSELKTQNSNSAFRPAVAIQQIFSLIKQSPTAAVRLAELSSLFAGMLSPADLEAIVGELQRRDYLRAGRPGEWRASERLNELFDEQTGPRASLSIYSNVQVADARTIAIRDQHTQRTVAQVDMQWFDRPLLTLEGRPVNVEWCDGEVMLVSSYQGQDAADRLLYRSARQLLSYELARLIPPRLGLPPGAAPFVAAPEGWWWFHWLGDLYGRAALDLLRYRVPAVETEQIGLYLLLPEEPQAPPAWTEAQVIQYLKDNYRKLEPMLALGPFQHLLPLHLRRRAVVEQFDVACFLEAITALRPLSAPESLAEDLVDLISEKT